MYDNTINVYIQKENISYRGTVFLKNHSPYSRLQDNLSHIANNLSAPDNSSFASSLSTNPSLSGLPPSSHSDQIGVAEKENGSKHSSYFGANHVESNLSSLAVISVSHEARIQQQQRFNAYLRSLDISFRAKPEFTINHIPHSESGLGNVINGIMTTAYIAAVSNRSFHSSFLMPA